MSWALAAFGTLPRSSFPHSGLLIRIIKLSGLSFGREGWKMLVVRVVARRFVTAASTLSTFPPNVLLFVCLIFLVYVMILAIKSGIFLLVIFSGIVCKNMTRNLVFFLILFLFLLRFTDTVLSLTTIFDRVVCADKGSDIFWRVNAILLIKQWQNLTSSVLEYNIL